ncbi:YdeI family protein [Maritimibacter sp. DP1N21-5]|uniref:YdeI/OmpD-associated family protein n=1 Tax=Maritimibacter sp. DP1N21-5 TaxID=2836867 RepID=UPI001C46586A|nr:YdeI/OmpD-associated family protein [Maritimibacter sp. DP1N21-5]MBV7410906.1 YdeI/OmpD-associated family protein [Maritimibacter sp. DP1N21-5]
MSDPTPFANREALENWLAANHARETELVVLLYKIKSGVPSITWDDLVEACLCWGWIDGIKRSVDEASYTQRITPRNPRSIWSRRNVGLVERLTAEGRMQPAGMAHVDAAKADGRWEVAYAGPKDATIPPDFFLALDAVLAARATFDALPKRWHYSIYHDLHSAKKSETRANRMARMIARLAEGLPPVNR